MFVRMRTMDAKQVEKTYQALYADTVQPGGKVSMKAVKRLLYEHAIMRAHAGMVYDEITGGQVTDPLAESDAVIDAFREFMREVME